MKNQTQTQIQVRYLTIKQAAVYLSAGESTIRRHIANGLIPTYKCGGSHLIDIQELDNRLHTGKLELN